MSHQTIPAQQPYTLTLPQSVKQTDFRAYLAASGKITNVAIVLLLAALVARVLMGLFMVSGPLANFTMDITAPLVAPFSMFIKDMGSMLQLSAAVAYCVYLPLYMIIKKIAKSSSSDPVYS
jgi:uncharacterized protein YggT (Ycf19 family)